MEPLALLEPFAASLMAIMIVCSWDGLPTYFTAACAGALFATLGHMAHRCWRFARTQAELRHAFDHD